MNNNQPPPEKGRSFFDMTDKEKEKILNQAAHESMKEQAKLVRKFNELRDGKRLLRFSVWKWTIELRRV